MVTHTLIKNRLKALNGILIKKETSLRTYYEKWTKEGNYYILEKRFYTLNSDPIKSPRPTPPEITKLTEDGLIMRVSRLCNSQGWELC